MKTCPQCGNQFPEEEAGCPCCASRSLEQPAPPTSPPAPTGRPMRTSRLAIFSLVLSILLLPLGLNIVGLILGLVALVRIRNRPGKLKGRGLAIGAIIIGLVWNICLIIAFPSEFKRFRARAQQVEAKDNLGEIYTMEVSYFGEKNAFADSFRAMKWAPQGLPRYSYFLPGEAIQASVGGPYQLPAGIKPAVSQNAFTVVAVGNVDSDPTLDVWTINDGKYINISNVIDDVRE